MANIFVVTTMVKMVFDFNSLHMDPYSVIFNVMKFILIPCGELINTR